MNPSGGLQPGQQRPTVVSPAPSQQTPIAAVMNTGAISGGGSLDADLEGTAAVIAAEERQARENSRLAQETHARGRWVKFAVIAVVALVGLSLVFIRHSSVNQQLAENAADASDRFPTTPIPLEQLNTNASGLQVQNAQSLSINGQLNVNNSLVITPTTRPNGAVTGQLYYDQTSNQLTYYNGSSFQPLLSGAQTSISGISGAIGTGAGLGVSGNTLRSTGVLTLQGQSGNITLAAGPGIVVNGTTLSNSGVLSLGGQGGNILLGSGLSLSGKTLSATDNVNSVNGAGAISVTNDGSGNYTVSLSALPGSGTVTSSGGANGTIGMFTGVQNIENSIITENSGTGTITVGGNLAVTGTLSLNSPLSVAQGGTGVGTLPTNSVLIGNGTSATSGITGSNGQLLIINGAGSPSFTSFSGAVAVSGTGATTIQPDAVALGTDTTGNYVANIGSTTGLTVGSNTGEGSTPTLSVTYGSGANTAVQGNTQLTCPSGTGNLTGGGTIITLGSGGTCGNLGTVNNPTFATSVTTPILQGAGLSVASTGANALTFGTNGSTRLTIASGGDLTATGSLALQGGSLGVGTATQGGSLALSDGSSNTGTLQVSPLAQNVVYTLPDPGTGSATICLNSGNCAGSGGGVTASGTVTANALTKFTGTGNAVTSSTITDNGTVVTTTVGLNVQGGTITVGTSGQLGSLVLNDGAGGQTTTVQAGNSASNLTFVLPTTAGSSNDCLQKGSGNQLVWGNCTGAGGSGSVTSLDGMNGDITVLGTNHEVTVTDNSGTGSITLSLPQDIDVTSAPSFGQLTVQSDQTTGDMLTVNNTDTGAPTGNLINLKLNGNSKLSVSSAGNVLGGTYNGQTIASTSSFTGDVSVAGTLTVNAISPSSALTVGVSGQSFTLQGNASSVIKAIGGSGTATVAFQSPTANVTYRFAAASASTYDICTTQGNCVGLGGGVTATSSTTGQVALFTGSNQVGDSVISQASGNIKIGTALSHANLEVTGTTTLDTPLSVTNGGTGLGSITANELLLANGTGSSFAQLANGSNGNCLVIESGVPVFDTCTGAGGVSSVNTKSGAVTLNGSTNQISIANPSGSTFTFSTPQNLDTGANVAFGTLNTTTTISTGGTQRIDGSGNLSNIGSITASSTIQGGSLTINSGGTITLNNLTGGSSTCLTLNASHVVGTATCATGSGSTPTLQNVYDNSSTTPIITLSSTGKGLFIQDASTTVGGNLFAVQNNAATTQYLAVTTSGASVTGTFSASSTINTNSGYLLNGTNINTSGTLNNVAYLGSTTVNFTGTNLQHGGNAVCDASNNCNYQAAGTYLTSSTGIQLQGSTPGTQQTGNFNISGTGLLGTLDSTGTTLGLGTSTATTVNIGSTGSTIKGTATHIGDTSSSTNAQTVVVGSIAANSGNTTTIQGGSGSGAVSIQAATSGTISIASSNNNTVAIGATTTTGTITIGGISTTGAITTQGQNITQTITGAASNPTDIVKGTSTGLFQVQNASSFAVLNVNTSSSQVLLGSSTHVNGSLAFADSGDSNTITLAATSVGSFTISVPGNGGTNLPQLDYAANFHQSSQTLPWSNTYNINGNSNPNGNTDTYLLVTLINGGGNSCANTQTVSFNGTNMTLLGSSTLGEANGSCYFTYGMTGTQGATGSHSITVSLTSGSASNTWYSLIVTSWYNVNQTTPYGTFQATAGGATDGSALTYNWPAGRMVVDSVSDQMYYSGNSNAYCQLGPEAPQKVAAVGAATSLGCVNFDGLNDYSAMGSSYAVSNGGSMTMAWASSPNAATNYVTDGSGTDDVFYWAAGAVDLIGDSGNTVSFGNTGTSGTNSSSDNQSWLCSPYISSSTGTVSSLTVQIATPAASTGTGADGVNHPNAAVAALYSNLDAANGVLGSPGVPLATSSMIGLTSGTNTFTLSTNPQVYAGTVYWMCFMSNTTATTNNLLKYDTNTTQPYEDLVINTGWAFNSWPSTLSALGLQFAFPGHGFEMTASVTLNNPAGTAFTLTNTGQVDLQNASDSTSAFQVQNASGMSLFNVDTADNQVDITGSLAGSVVREQQATSGTAPTDMDTVINPAVGYNLSSIFQTGSGASVVTFNITGLPQVEGTIAYIMTTAIKVTTSSGNDTTVVQINGTTMSSLQVLSVNGGGTGTVHKDYTVMYSGGVWHIVGYGPTSSSTTQQTFESADYAEYIPYSGDTTPQPGDVLTVGDDYTSVKDATTPYDSHVIGVVSTTPYQVGSADDGHSVVMALTGRAPVKVSLENGPITAGDPLTSSSTPGVAMKATEGGQIIGTALEAYDGTEPTNEINVQLHPGYDNPNPGSIQGDGNIAGNLTVGGNTTLQDLVVNGSATLASLHVSGSVSASSITVGTIIVTGNASIGGDLIVNGHFASTQTTAPVINTPSSCAASSASTIASGSTDSAGSFTITSGTGSQTSGCTVTITFNQVYKSPPKSIILTPGANVNSGTVTRTASVTDIGTNGFTVTMGGSATDASTDYVWYYWVIQ